MHIVGRHLYGHHRFLDDQFVCQRGLHHNHSPNRHCTRCRLGVNGRE